MGDSTNRLYVHLAADIDAADYRARWTRGLEPDPAPYGFHHAASLGWVVRYSTARRPRHRPWQGLLARIDRLTAGIDVWHAWRNRRAIRGADVIWTMLEREAFAIAALMAMRLVPRRPLVTGAVWMFNDWGGMSRSRRRVMLYLAGFCTSLNVHSDGCLRVAEKATPSLAVRLMVFGVSSAAFPITAPRESTPGPIVVFAMGNDRTRDWSVLLRALGNDDRFAICIVCRWFTDDEASRFSNLRVVRDPSLNEVRALYAEADYVAIPMRKNVFSGITVALEAAALGVPLLATRTGGIDTYFTDDEVLFFHAGDPDGLRAVVLSQSAEARMAMARRAQAHSVAGDYTTFGLIHRYSEVALKVIRPSAV